MIVCAVFNIAVMQSGSLRNCQSVLRSTDSLFIQRKAVWYNSVGHIGIRGKDQGSLTSLASPIIGARRGQEAGRSRGWRKGNGNTDSWKPYGNGANGIDMWELQSSTKCYVPNWGDITNTMVFVGTIRCWRLSSSMQSGHGRGGLVAEQGMERLLGKSSRIGIGRYFHYQSLELSIRFDRAANIMRQTG